MAVADHGRPAATRYQPLRVYSSHTHVQLDLETGRTHLIRVHMTHIGHPLCGDPVYRPRSARHANNLELTRQALHAKSLSFQHPSGSERATFESPLPDDFAHALDLLEAHEQ